MFKLWIALLLTAVCSGCTITRMQLVAKIQSPSGVEYSAAIQGEN